MLSIDIPLAPAQPYENTFITVHSEAQTLRFDLSPGAHTAVSPAVAIGVVHGLAGRRLVAAFSFGYDYDPDGQIVTVTGPDFAAPQSMTISTTPEGLDETCVQRAGGAGFQDAELTANPRWNYLRTPQAPGLREHLDNLVRVVADQVIHVLEQQPGLVVQVRKHPTPAAADALSTVLIRYRAGEFVGFQGADEEAEPGEDTVGLQSVFGGEVTLSYGENFANVIGSTDDPKIGGLTWIRLWAGQFGVYPVICTSYQSYGFACSGDILGGHVIGGRTARRVPQGSNAVWIFPICVPHNNDDHVSMQGLRYLKGVWLHNYLGT